MRRHFKHLRFKTFLMVSWGPNVVLIFLSNQGFKHSQLHTSVTPKMGMHLEVIELHPLHFSPFVRVFFTPKHLSTSWALALHTLLQTQCQGCDRYFINSRGFVSLYITLLTFLYQPSKVLPMTSNNQCYATMSSYLQRIPLDRPITT